MDKNQLHKIFGPTSARLMSRCFEGASYGVYQKGSSDVHVCVVPNIYEIRPSSYPPLKPEEKPIIPGYMKLCTVMPLQGQGETREESAAAFWFKAMRAGDNGTLYQHIATQGQELTPIVVGRRYRSIRGLLENHPEFAAFVPVTFDSPPVNFRWSCKKSERMYLRLNNLS